MDIIIDLIKNNVIRNYFKLYDKINNPVYGDDYNKITSHLYLGNYSAAKDYSMINKLNINFVVNCSNTLPFPNFYKQLKSPSFRFMRIGVNDSRDDVDQLIMTTALPHICPLIYNLINNKRNVFVHCRAGKQRSATVVLCYLMYRDFMNHKLLPLQKYYDYLRSKRVVVFRPDPTFETVIEKYYLSLKNKNANIIA